MNDTPLLDHVVVNVRTDMDRAAQWFDALGFTLTARGFHSLGSINHLVIFATDYLELLGVPADRPDARPEVAGAPLGLGGLVFKTDDVDRTFLHLDSLGMAGGPPIAFSRPVEINGVEHHARFRTVTVRAGVFDAGRVYFCEHATPDLVWRDEWRRHANGTSAIAEVVMVAREPAYEAERFARLLDRPVGFEPPNASWIDVTGSRLVFVDPRAYRERLGALACELGARSSMLGALVLRTSSLADARGHIEGCGEAFHVFAHEDRLIVRVAALDTVLELTGRRG